MGKRNSAPLVPAKTDDRSIVHGVRPVVHSSSGIFVLRCHHMIPRAKFEVVHYSRRHGCRAATWPGFPPCATSGVPGPGPRKSSSNQTTEHRMKTISLALPLAALFCLAIGTTTFAQTAPNSVLFTPNVDLSSGTQNGFVGTVAAFF